MREPSQLFSTRHRLDELALGRPVAFSIVLIIIWWAITLLLANGLPGRVASKNDPPGPANQRESIEFDGEERLRFWQRRREADETSKRLKASRRRLWSMGRGD